MTLVKAIVTGGAGFIGSHLVERLVKEGFEVEIVDNLSRGTKEHVADVLDESCKLTVMDLRHYNQTISTIKDADIVFHLANVVAGITWHRDHEAELCANFALNYNVFQACAINKIPRVLYTSSSCVYPRFIQTEAGSPYLTENLAMDLGAAPTGPYGWSKLIGEVQLHAHMKQYGIKGICLRPFNVYGPREDFVVGRAHVIPAIIRRALAKEDPLEVWGSGNQERGFTYITDIIEAFMIASETEACENGQPINVGYPAKVKIRDVAEKVIKLAGYNPEIKFLTDMPEGDFSKGPDITRAKEVLGWEPKVPFDEGLRMTWEWAEKNVSP